MAQTGLFESPWQGSLRDLARVIDSIRRSQISGRLSLRNTERLSVAHFYFQVGRLAHIVGNRGDPRAIVVELKEWRRGFVRFDRGVSAGNYVLDVAYEQLVDEVLQYLSRQGLVVTPNTPRVIESNVIITREVKQLITPWEWRVLVEGMRRVSLAVAYVVGPEEAMNVLRDILDDCTSAFPAFASLRVAPSGYLQVIDGSQLDRLPRGDLLEGFTALISICEYFCSPIVGEKNAHRLLVQALQDVGPALASLGVFQLGDNLLSDHNRQHF